MFFFTDFSCDVIAVLIGHIFTFLFRDWNTSLFWNLFAILIGFLVTLGVLFLHIPDSVNLDALGLRQLLACFWKLLPDFVIVALKTRLPVVNWWGLWIRNNSIFVANVHHPGIVKGNCCIFWWANKCCAAHNMVFSIFLPSSHQKSKKNHLKIMERKNAGSHPNALFAQKMLKTHTSTSICGVCSTRRQVEIYNTS